MGKTSLGGHLHHLFLCSCVP